MTTLETQHLLKRAGFGLFPSQLEAWKKLSPKAAVDKIIGDSKTDEGTRALEVVEEPLFTREEMQGKGLEERKKLAQQSQAKMRQLNIAWLDAMSTKPSFLREKLSLFWHSHFASNTTNVWLSQTQINLIRKHSLGSFREFVKDISRDAVMLNFLNGLQNTKSSPNENFARELLELFTMGRGTYGESDIRAAASAFTGYKYRPFTGEYFFREVDHDSAPKTFFGKTKSWSGDEIVDAILEKRRCSEFITQKMVSYFAAGPMDQSTVDNLAKRFYESDYNIETLIRGILSADAFYDAKLIGTRIKAPVELLVGMRRDIGMRFTKPEPAIVVQRMLGQQLLLPPSVEGWKEGKNWIDTSTLVFRLRLAEQLIAKSGFDTQAKEEVSTEPSDATSLVGPGQQKDLAQAQSMVSWTEFANALGGKPSLETIANFLLQVPLSVEGKNAVIKVAGPSSSNDYLKKSTIALMSLPEYQVC